MVSGRQVYVRILRDIEDSNIIVFRSTFSTRSPFIGVVVNSTIAASRACSHAAWADVPRTGRQPRCSGVWRRSLTTIHNTHAHSAEAIPTEANTNRATIAEVPGTRCISDPPAAPAPTRLGRETVAARFFT